MEAPRIQQMNGILTKSEYSHLLEVQLRIRVKPIGDLYEEIELKAEGHLSVGLRVLSPQCWQTFDRLIPVK